MESYTPQLITITIETLNERQSSPWFILIGPELHPTYGAKGIECASSRFLINRKRKKFKAHPDGILSAELITSKGLILPMLTGSSKTLVLNTEPSIVREKARELLACSPYLS